MAKFRSIKNSLIAGEIGASSLGRTDLQVYPHACEMLNNMLPLIGGGAYRRPGTKYVVSRDLNEDVNGVIYPWIIPFEATQQLSYIATSFDSSSPSATTLGIFLQSTTHAFTETSLKLQTSSVPFTRYTHLANSADVVYGANKDLPPFRLRKDTTQTFPIFLHGIIGTDSNVDAGRTAAQQRDSMPYYAKNVNTEIRAKITNVAGTDYVNFEDSGANPVYILDDDMAGTYLKVFPAGTYGCVKLKGNPIGAPVNGKYTSYAVDVIVSPASAAATVNWWWGAWSPHFGYPRTVTFHLGRLAFGGNKATPDTLWFSKAGDYSTFSKQDIADPLSVGTGNEEEAFSWELGDPNLSEINWLYSGTGGRLFVGTLRNEYTLGYDEGDVSGFWQNSIRMRKESAFGSMYLPVAKGGEELFFVSADGSTVRSFVFNDTEQSYQAESLQTLFNEYPAVSRDTLVPRRAFGRIAWDNTRNILWCCDESGNLFSLTRDRKNGITAWATHSLGGSGKVFDIAIIQDYETSLNRVCFAVSRIDYQDITQYFLEFLYSDHSLPASAYAGTRWNTYPTWLDCSRHYETDGAQIYVANLRGYTASGVYYNSGTVSGGVGLFTLPSQVVGVAGAITVDSSADLGPVSNTVWYGLNYTATVKPVRLEAGSQIGTAQGAVKRIHKTVVQFYKTMSGKIGRDADNLEEIIFRAPDTPLNKSTEFFTGYKQIFPDSDYDLDGYLILVQDKPLPFSVLSIVSEGMTYD